MNRGFAKLTRRSLLVTGVALLIATPVGAQDRLSLAASFTILADFVKNVGGDRVTVATLVGPDGNPHVFEPSPTDARKIAAAKIVFVNGLGFEGWFDRLIKASGAKAAIVVATQGIAPRTRAAGAIDPHAWQSIANARIYVANIQAALIAADPAGRAIYDANATGYLGRLDALDRAVKETMAHIPPERRRVMSSHNAFGYFQDAYGIDFVAPQGVSTETEPSARAVAAIITQIRTQKIAAVFLENITDPRLAEQIAHETGAKIGGTLYSDALTGPGGAAPSYIDMIRHNVSEIAKALAK